MPSVGVLVLVCCCGIVHYRTGGAGSSAAVEPRFTGTLGG